MPAMGAMGGVLGSSGGLAAMGSLGSGVLGYFGAKTAADQQAKGQQQAYQMFAPYAQSGAGALTTLNQLYGLTGPNGGAGDGKFNMGVLNSMPGYDWSKQQIMKATDFADTARGSLLGSANMQKQQQNVGNIAATNYQNYVTPLMQIAQMGAQGASGAASALGNIGNANASGTVGGFNAIGQGLSGAFNAYNTGQNNQMYRDFLGSFNKSAYGNGNTGAVGENGYKGYVPGSF